LVCFFTLLCSCRKAQLTQDEYIRYISDPENGLVLEKKIQDYKITLSYLPVEYMALKELKILNEPIENYTLIKDKYKDHNYFNLRIENLTGSNSPVRKDASDYPEYAQKLDYLTFFGQNDMKMVVNSDTIDCVLYNFENNFQLLPFNDIQMAFRNTQIPDTDLEIIWNDVVTGVGRVKFTLNKKNLNNIPEPIL
jgi:hypothetical protein